MMMMMIVILLMLIMMNCDPSDRSCKPEMHAQHEGGPEQVAHQANQVGQAHCEPAYGHKGIPAHCGEAPNNGQKHAMQRADCAAQEGAVQEDGPQYRIVG